jgi:recombinational DNA repair protein RecR
MKTYTFTVTVEDSVEKSNIIDELFAEIIEEKRQLALTHAINKETTRVHREILESIGNNIKETLKRIGVKVSETKDGRIAKNLYKSSSLLICFPKSRQSNSLEIVGSPQYDFKESMYTTYTGKYQLELNGYPVDTVENIIQYVRPNIKKEIELIS